MNQKLINIILGAGIAVMLFLHLKNSSSATGSSSVKSDTAKALKLAYVDLDSIQEKYVFYKEKMQEFEKKKESADRDLNNAFQKIEAEKNAFAQRGNSITQAEYENFQRAYQGKMQNLDQQKQMLENNIAAEGSKTMEDLKKRINDFLVDYNKKQAYSYIFSYSAALNILFYKDPAQDITDEVVAGLNAAYNKTGDKK
ncbi:MAG: OmpH family outer membrane protein [Chitinophagaceae bacterium]|nr:OmpH family outer membrane protein [Chitinophagaceae bacterium]